MAHFSCPVTEVPSPPLPSEIPSPIPEEDGPCLRKEWVLSVKTSPLRPPWILSGDFSYLGHSR